MRTFIIAEAGVNHNGSLDTAKQLIDVACQAGADAVKFQTFNAGKVVSKNATKAEYQEATTDSSESQLAMLRRLELDSAMHNELIHYCQQNNIIFMSTPFDHDSIRFLAEMNMGIFKIPSGEITNLPYLRHIGCLNKQVILSTGMADLGEIEDALNVLIEAGTPKDNITVLHANTEYPTPMDDVNLRAMVTIGYAFDITYGYSDHTLGIEVDIAAVALGAQVIEKHFTLDRSMEGPDHRASLEPNELRDMVNAIRNIEKALGNGIKKPSASEIKNKPKARKSLVANADIKKGDVFTETNVAIKRPGTGKNPMRWNEVLGSEAARDYQEDELL